MSASWWYVISWCHKLLWQCGPFNGLYGLPCFWSVSKDILLDAEGYWRNKFFPQTAYRDSKDFVGITIKIKIQGICQGNGAAQVGWSIISITIIRVHKRKGHVAPILCHNSDTQGVVSTIHFINDTDIIHLNMETYESIVNANIYSCKKVSDSEGIF